MDASRIEVLRGSGSSLYGTNSMSGTVNIITDRGGGVAHGDLDVQGGGLGLFRGIVRWAGGALNSRLAYSVGLSDLNITKGVDDVGAVRDWSGQTGVSFSITPNIRIGANVFAIPAICRRMSLHRPRPTRRRLELFLQFRSRPRRFVWPIPTRRSTRGMPRLCPSLGDPDAGRYSHFINSLFRFEHAVNSRLSYRIAYGIVDTSRNYTDGPGGPNLPVYSQPLFNTADRYTARIDTVQARADYLLGSHQLLSGGYQFSSRNIISTSPQIRTRTPANAHISERMPDKGAMPFSHRIRLAG